MKITTNILGLLLILVALFLSCSEEDSSSSSNPTNATIELKLNDDLVENNSDISYGTTYLGIEIIKTFTIKNTGNANLSLSNLAVIGEFSVGQNFAKLTVLPSESITFKIKFNSTSIGVKTGKISFSSNDKDQSSFEINLTAEALIPESSRVEFSQESTVLVISPIPTVDFGLVEIGKNTTKEFVVKNVGKADLTLLNLSLPNKFILVTGFESSNLAYLETTKFKVKYNASSSEEQITGPLIFNTNDPIRNLAQINLKAETIQPIHVYFPLKVGNSWTFDRQSPIGTSTSEISNIEITNAGNIFGGGITVEKITKNVYDYFLTGDYFLGENIGNLEINNLKFFNEYDPELITYNSTFNLPTQKIPIENLTITQGTLKNIVVTINAKVYLDIKKLSENEDWTVNSQLYGNTQNTQWDFYLSATASFSGTLETSEGDFPIKNLPNPPHSLIDKRSIGYNQIRLARDIGPIETIQNINFKTIVLNKIVTTPFGPFDLTDQLTPIETQIRSVNDINSSKLKSYSISF